MKPTRDGCSVQARLVLMAGCKLAARGCPCGFRFGGILCHDMGCFSERVFESICLPATCDHCCPNRVQDRQGSPANTLKNVVSAHPQRLTFGTEHMAPLHHCPSRQAGEGDWFGNKPGHPTEKVLQMGIRREHRIPFWSKLQGMKLPQSSVLL